MPSPKYKTNSLMEMLQNATGQRLNESPGGIMWTISQKIDMLEERIEELEKQLEEKNVTEELQHPGYNSSFILKV